MIEIAIRPAGERDDAAIDRVGRLASCREAEGRLVAALRHDGDVVVELVAVGDDAICGDVLFSRLPMENAARRVDAAALAPLAVVALGNPAWYPRFGFSASLAERPDAPFAGAAFPALELLPDALAAGGGVRYAHAFGLAQPHKESTP